MRICIIGTGYVGLVTGACLSSVGHTVYCVDTDASKIDFLNEGKIPFYEPGIFELVLKSRNDETLSFHTSIKDIAKAAEIYVIAVGTPPKDDGSANLEHVERASRDIGKHISKNAVIINKSTVPVGTSANIKEWVSEELRKRNAPHKVSVVSNPEFLKEGNAIEDFVRPNRIIIGSDDSEAIEIIKEMYSPFNQKKDRILIMSTESAELTKYASNAMLATRISFMNEIAALCEKTGANINDIRLGMGADERIGASFLYAGCGYGGSCFPKDVLSLTSMQKQAGLDTFILEAVDEVNKRQKHVLGEKVKAHFGGDLTGKRIAVWGLSFKPKTDDIREAPALTFIRDVLDAGASVTAHCPQGMPNAEKEFGNNPNVTFAQRKYSALDGADALALLTEWAEFRNPDFDEIGSMLKNKVVFDGRNIYSRSYLEKKGFTLYQMGM